MKCNLKIVEYALDSLLLNQPKEDKEFWDRIKWLNDEANRRKISTYQLAYEILVAKYKRENVLL